MSLLLFTGLVGIGAVAGGMLGGLTGLGGGMVIVPMLTILFHVDLRYAIGASLVSVIATSSGAAAAYVKEGYTNVRVGMLLEVATTLGALGGAYLAGRIGTGAIAVIFAIVLLYSAYRSTKPLAEHVMAQDDDPLSRRLRLASTYPTRKGLQPYGVKAVPAGFSLMLVAGVLSGLLGIGSGAPKGLGMDQLMALPFKVSTTTSNFMIGVTAAASAGIYLSRGYIDPGLSMPVMLGVLAGAFTGARFLVVAKSATLRHIFALVILTLALEMAYKGLRGGL